MQAICSISCCHRLRSLVQMVHMMHRLVQLLAARSDGCNTHVSCGQQHSWSPERNILYVSYLSLCISCPITQQPTSASSCLFC
jgi:hypothetical protein